MKNLIITGKRIQTEIKILAACFGLAIVFNIYAITKYNSGWSELLTQLDIEILLAAIIYCITGAIRILIRSMHQLSKKN